MTKPSLITCLGLSLLVSACSTQGQKPPILPSIKPVAQCKLTPCYLPGRPALVQNDDWPKAVDEAEAALLSCAVQVLGCIELQDVQAQKSPR